MRAGGIGTAFIGSGKFHAVSVDALDEMAGVEWDVAREAMTLACCICIELPPPSNRSTLDPILPFGGGCSASGSGDGGLSHRPRAAAVSIKLRVRE